MSLPARSRRSPKTVRRGVATVELATVLPLFVLIVLGTIEACSMLYLTQSLHIAAYEATRVSLIPKSTSTQVHDAAQQILQDRKVSDAVITIQPANYSALSMGAHIQVVITAPADSNNPIAGIFFLGKTMTGSCTMMKEY
jgi:Flp pilus assembly protein TadG